MIEIPVVIPFRNLWSMTQVAASDCELQVGDVLAEPIVVVDNMSGYRETSAAVRWINLGRPAARDLIRMPGTVCQLWNAALDVLWKRGFELAWVVNNDVRLNPRTLQTLYAALTEAKALFTSAVGVRDMSWIEPPSDNIDALLANKGGPDYSCFLITKECHRRYRFDDRFTYFGDNDHHHRLKIAGAGSRIFSVNVPYYHKGSQTLEQSEDVRAEVAEQFEKHREIFKLKWGALPGELG